MKLDMLDALDDAELRVIITRANDLLKKHDEERKAKALSDARALLASVGLTLKDLGKVRGKPARGPLYKAGMLYRHPTDATLLWDAKGKKPEWLVRLEGKGGKPVEAAAPNDAVIGAKKATVASPG